MFVKPDHSKADILETLLAFVTKAGLNIGRVYLDKGFASIPGYWLGQYAFAAVIACPARGKPDGAGTRALCQGKASYHTQPTVRSPSYGSCHVPVTSVRTWTLTRQGYLFVQLGTPLAPSKGRAGYRLRFGVESSYRCMREVKGKTSTSNPAVRLLFMALAFILVNLWVLLRFLFCQIPRRGRGGRPLDECRFRLNRFASLLRRAIERRYGVLTAIEATAPPIGV